MQTRFFCFFVYKLIFVSSCQHIATWQSLWGGFDTWILYIQYINTRGLVILHHQAFKPFNLKLITSGTSFTKKTSHKAEGTRNILLSKRDVADVLWLESLNVMEVFNYGFIDNVVSYRITVSFLVLLIYNYTHLTLSSCL